MLDHLAYGVPDLDAACHELAERLGIRPMQPEGKVVGIDASPEMIEIA